MTARPRPVIGANLYPPAIDADLIPRFRAVALFYRFDGGVDLEFPVDVIAFTVLADFDLDRSLPNW